MNETTPGGGGDRPADIDSRINAMADRAVGAVIGSAVGDALGAGYEGSYPDQDEEIVMVGGRIASSPGAGGEDGPTTPPWRSECST